MSHLVPNCKFWPRWRIPRTTLAAPPNRCVPGESSPRVVPSPRHPAAVPAATRVSATDSLLLARRRRDRRADMALRHGWFRALLLLAALLRARRHAAWFLRGIHRELILARHCLYDRLHTYLRCRRKS